MISGTRTDVWRCALLCAACFIMPSLALTRMTDVTLAELVRGSDAIVLGHVSPNIDSPATSTSNPILFEVSSVVKGSGITPAKNVLLCNSHRNSELPDLSKLRGDSIMFLSKGNGCFDLSHGYVSVIQVIDGRASTYAIMDQPKSRKLQALLRELNVIVKGR